MDIVSIMKWNRTTWIKIYDENFEKNYRETREVKEKSLKPSKNSFVKKTF